MDALGALIAQRQRDDQGFNNLIGTLQSWTHQNRMKNLSTAFFEQQDFSPEGIKSFAEKNNLTVPEMLDIVKTVQAFNQYKKSLKPKLYQVNQVDENGNTHLRLMTEDEIKNSPPQTGIAKPGKPLTVSRGEAVYDPKTGKWTVPNPVTPKPNWKVYKNIRTGGIRRIDLNKEDPPSGIDWVEESKYSGPKSGKDALNDNIKILDTSIKVLRNRLPQGNIFMDMSVDDLMNPANKQNYIQMFQEAAKSKDPYTKQAALKGLKAITNILGPIETPKPKTFKMYKNKKTGQIVKVWSDGTVEGQSDFGQHLTMPIQRK